MEEPTLERKRVLNTVLSRNDGEWRADDEPAKFALSLHGGAAETLQLDPLSARLVDAHHVTLPSLSNSLLRSRSEAWGSALRFELPRSSRMGSFRTL